jgi:hypothetical protein
MPVPRSPKRPRRTTVSAAAVCGRARGRWGRDGPAVMRRDARERGDDVPELRAHRSRFEATRRPARATLAHRGPRRWAPPGRDPIANPAEREDTIHASSNRNRRHDHLRSSSRGTTAGGDLAHRPEPPADDRPVVFVTGRGGSARRSARASQRRAGSSPRATARTASTSSGSWRRSSNTTPTSASTRATLARPRTAGARSPR